MYVWNLKYSEIIKIILSEGLTFVDNNLLEKQGLVKGTPEEIQIKLLKLKFELEQIFENKKININLSQTLFCPKSQFYSLQFVDK